MNNRKKWMNFILNIIKKVNSMITILKILINNKNINLNKKHKIILKKNKKWRMTIISHKTMINLKRNIKILKINAMMTGAI